MSDRPPLDVSVVRRAVGDRWPRIDVVDETGSTNADLLDTASIRGDREVLVAEFQSSGRGRLERTWTSPPRAGLHASMLVRPGAPTTQWGWLPLLTGVAVAEAIDEAAGVHARLKWPNDVLLADDRKVCGILVQTNRDAVVIGIGINVSLTVDELPVPTATSLALAGAASLDRSALLVAVLQRLDLWLMSWRGDATASGLAAAYRDRCRTIGQDVRVTRMGDDPLRGRAVGVDDSGRLLVDDGSTTVAVSAGDVEHVRPSDRL